MKIKVRVHPNSSQEKIKQSSKDNYEVWIKEKPLDGRANAKLIKLLKKSFKKSIKITSGLSSNNKIVEVL